MSTTTEHDEAHSEQPDDTAVADGCTLTQTAPSTDTSTDSDAVATIADIATAADTTTTTHAAIQTDPSMVARPGDQGPRLGARPRAPGPHRQSDAPWIAVALVAIATVIVGSLVWLSGSSGEPTSTSPAVTDAVGETTIDTAEALQRLVERGYVAQQATDREQAITDDLARRGIVPSGRFDDLAMQDLQARGLVPSGTTFDEDEILRDLQFRGLVPSGRFDDPALRDLQSRGHLPTARGDG